MHVNGSGGSFSENNYNLAPAVAWELGLQVCREMKVDVEKQDDTGMLLNGSLLTGEKSFLFGRPKRKEIVFAVQPLKDGCTVIVDIHKKRIEVYSLKPQNRETDQFVAGAAELSQVQCRAAEKCGILSVLRGEGVKKSCEGMGIHFFTAFSIRNL